MKAEVKMKKEICFSRDDGKLFLLSLFSAILIYFSRIANELPNPDAIWQGMAYKSGWAWESALGRYMIGLLQKVRCNIVPTEFVTLLGLIFLAAICVLIVKLFHITDALSGFVIIALLVVSPTVGSTLSYYYCSDMYFLSYLLAVGSSFLLIRNHTRKSLLLGALGICLSAAIYQAYIGIAIMLCFLHIWFLVFDEKYSLADIGKTLVRLMVGGCCGIVLYLCSNKLLQQKFGIQAVTDRGFASMGQIPLKQIPNLFGSTYKAFFDYFFSSGMINNGVGKRMEINCLFFLFAFFLLSSILIVKKLPISRKILAIVILFLMPPVAMSIVIMAPGVSIYDTTGVLMLPEMNYVYVAFVILYAKQKDIFRERMGKTGKVLLMVCCMLVCYMLVVLELSGQTYLKHHLNKMQTVARMVMEEIEENVDNSAAYKVCFVGSMENGNFPEKYQDLAYSVKWTTASYKTVWNSFNGRQYCWINYIAHYLGKQYYACSQSEFEGLIVTEEYQSMQNFPDEGSVKVIGDIIVIKLSDM